MNVLIRALLVSLAAISANAAIIDVPGDNSAAIAAAIARSQPGDTVRLPEGRYTITETIHPKPHTRLLGAGQEKTILVFEGTAPCVMLSVSGCDEIEVAGFTLDANHNPNVTQGISGGNARGVRLHHLTVRNLVKTDTFGPHGMLFAGVNPSREGGLTDSEIADCRIENIAPDAAFGCGLRCSWGSSRNRILRNFIDNTGRGGIFGDNGSTDLVIQGNTISGSHGEGLAIEVWGGCDRAVIEDNRMDHWLSIGGSDCCAVRRNVIRDTSGEYKFCGIEGIGSYCVITDNTVDGGQKIGLSVSGPQPKEYIYWAHNAVRGCIQWGAQFQGEAGGIACHYLYRNTFEGMPVGVGPVWYPGDEGHGFRINGNTRGLTFEECRFAGNGRAGLQCVGAGIDTLHFVRCTITGNKGPAIIGLANYSALEWSDCVVTGNAGDALPPARPFPAPAPTASFAAPAEVNAGEEVAFSNTSEAQSAAWLWDFGDGAPSIERNPKHTYARPGAYRVTLLVWDAARRAGRHEQEVKVKS